MTMRFGSGIVESVDVGGVKMAPGNFVVDLTLREDVVDADPSDMLSSPSLLEDDSKKSDRAGLVFARRLLLFFFQSFLPPTSSASRKPLALMYRWTARAEAACRFVYASGAVCPSAERIHACSPWSFSST